MLFIITFIIIIIIYLFIFYNKKIENYNNNKKFYKIIFVIIASDTDYYNKNKKILNKFMNSNKDVKTFYIYCNKNLHFNCNKKKLNNEENLYFNCNESLRPGILQKTIQAFQYINKHYNYDYIIRTNLSTFWNINHLLQQIQKLPKEKCLAGQKCRSFISGTGIILSHDLVNVLINDKNKLNYKNADDVEISHYLHNNYNIKYINEPRFDEYKKSIPKNKKSVPKDFTSFRVKTKKNRNLDSHKMYKLWNFLYT